MDEPIGAKLDSADLERFLESFRRAVQMQRKAFLNRVQRVHFPDTDTLPYPAAGLADGLELRTWLDDEPPRPSRRTRPTSG